MDKPLVFKSKFLTYLGAILNVVYGIVFYFNTFKNVNNGVLVFLVSVLFLCNIIWILLFYSLHLSEDKSNVNELRITILFRATVFFSLNAFRTIESSYSWIATLYLFLVIIISVVIYFIDRRMFEKYNDVS